MKVTAITTPIIQPQQPLLPILRDALPRPLRERDIIGVASKVVALEQGRLVDLSTIQPSAETLALLASLPSAGANMHPGLAELIRRESDLAFPGSPVWLTLKEGVLVANAGIDLSNAPAGHAILWPQRPWDWAYEFRARLKLAYNLNQLGIIVTDSRCVPLRKGVTGVAIAYSGFEGVESQKGKPDLFGRPLSFTEKAVADDLASAAILVSGEAGEGTPFVLVEDAPVVFTEQRYQSPDVLIDPCIDMFGPIYSEDFRRCSTPTW